MTDVLIVGGGHAGAACAAALRQRKFDGEITVLGEEPYLPYERPPLSKDYLAGEKPFERMLIRPETFWAERDVRFRLGETAMQVLPEEHVVTTGTGEHIQYGTLVWATGGTPRRLDIEGSNLSGVHVIRTRMDVDHLSEALDEEKHVAIIGGGYIGLEAASALRKLGHRITLVEVADRVLARVAGRELSDFFEQEHRARGVDLRLAANVERFLGEATVEAIQLSTGEHLPVDLVIVGIGIIPQVRPLLEAGAKGGNGVWVSDRCHTSLPDVYAIGDCALHANRFAGGAEIRLESVQNANDMAQVAAKNIAGVEASYGSVPWFWSDQYDVKLQTVGLSLAYDETLVRGAQDERSFSVVYLKQGRIVALDCVNRPADYMAGRKIIEAGGEVDLALLRDQNTPLKSLIPQPPRQS
ncbi:MAG: NAD(P)/FAD-dependent oxidoreductase [Parvularcula sp.]